jgi:hypothetical protein
VPAATSRAGGGRFPNLERAHASRQATPKGDNYDVMAGIIVIVAPDHARRRIGSG